MSEMAKRVVVRHLQAARLTGPARDSLKKLLANRRSLFNPDWKYYPSFIKDALETIEAAKGARRLLPQGEKSQRDVDVERAQESLTKYTDQIANQIANMRQKSRPQLEALNAAILTAAKAGVPAKRVATVSETVHKAFQDIDKLATRAKAPDRFDDAGMFKGMTEAVQALKEMDELVAGAYGTAEALLK